MMFENAKFGKKIDLSKKGLPTNPPIYVCTSIVVPAGP